jgi:ankyrin repeat protein
MVTIQHRFWFLSAGFQVSVTFLSTLCFSSIDKKLAAAFGFQKIARLLVSRFQRRDPTLVCLADSQGRNPLHFAARYNQVEVMRIIMQPLTQRDKRSCAARAASNGWTPLHYAARYDHQLNVCYYGKGARIPRGICWGSSEFPLHRIDRAYVRETHPLLTAGFETHPRRRRNFSPFPAPLA